MKLSRKHFVQLFPVALGGTLLLPTKIIAQTATAKGDPLSKELVQEFVAKAHSNFDIVKQLLEETPVLIHAAHDWGGGDFETGIGAASHVGHKEIALYLIEHGAYINIFTAAMLGKLELVQQLVTLFPKQLQAKGPHGLDLIHHAKKGGDAALPVLEYLERTYAELENK